MPISHKKVNSVPREKKYSSSLTHKITTERNILCRLYMRSPCYTVGLAAHLFNTGEGLVSLQGPLYGFPDKYFRCIWIPQRPRGPSVNSILKDICSRCLCKVFETRWSFTDICWSLSCALGIGWVDQLKNAMHSQPPRYRAINCDLQTGPGCIPGGDQELLIVWSWSHVEGRGVLAISDGARHSYLTTERHSHIILLTNFCRNTMIFRTGEVQAVHDVRGEW